jgi:hypothetical protein
MQLTAHSLAQLSLTAELERSLSGWLTSSCDSPPFAFDGRQRCGTTCACAGHAGSARGDKGDRPSRRAHWLGGCFWPDSDPG